MKDKTKQPKNKDPIRTRIKIADIEIETDQSLEEGINAVIWLLQQKETQNRLTESKQFRGYVE